MKFFSLKKNWLPVAVASLLVTACNNETELNDAEALNAMTADSLAHHIAILASDDFQGRKPFTEGETKTIQYLEAQFRAAGLEPGNGDSYLQEVPMVSITTEAAPAMLVNTKAGQFSLKGFDEYVIWTDKTDSEVMLDQSEVVFAGYGVVAPEYNWNDYEGLDVKGKVVMVLVNDPGFAGGDSTLFKGKTMTYYGRWTYKFEEAARQGARGCLIVHETAGASYPFTVVQNNWNGTRLRLDNRGKEESLCDVIGWVSTPAAEKLLKAAGKDKSLLAAADNRGFKGEALGIRLSTSIQVKTNYSKSHNVVAKITGSKKPDEYVIYTAHWDHLGIAKPDEKGDSIYNGALDNASATAGLFEIARAFKKLNKAPERSILLLAVTAEEQGLWGSAWYAQNPIYPIKNTVANINMDVLNWYGATRDIIVVGQGQSELEDILADAAKEDNRVVAFEPHPEAGFYYRSDHFNFAKVGVPALYTESGIDVIGKDADYGKTKNAEYTSALYHRPADEYNPESWDLSGAVADLKLFFKVGLRVANAEKKPEWKAGSEFKK
ncbi:MAG: M28 family metallopeptidase [Chitinophagaceae bacterium]|nr:M28 family metallopeptidase [Chitinophagaceae bacterium]